MCNAVVNKTRFFKMPKQHESVLEREVIQNLNLLGGSLIVDGTLGDGGHAELLLKNTTSVRV